MTNTVIRPHELRCQLAVDKSDLPLLRALHRFDHCDQLTNALQMVQRDNVIPGAQFMVQLPENWQMSTIGKMREFYDEANNLRLTAVFGAHGMAHKVVPHTRLLLRGYNDGTWGVYDYQDCKPLVTGLTWLLACDWLHCHYPHHDDPSAYWNQPLRPSRWRWLLAQLSEVVATGM